jgi:hypothetical protein
MTAWEILLGGLGIIVMGAIVLSGLLFVVGETVEHFTR